MLSHCPDCLPHLPLILSPLRLHGAADVDAAGAGGNGAGNGLEGDSSGQEKGPGVWGDKAPVKLAAASAIGIFSPGVIQKIVARKRLC